MNFQNTINKNKSLQEIKEIIQKLNVQSYLVGGFVRDLILNRKSKDIDIMTLGQPYELLEKIAKSKNFSDFNIFKKYGTGSIKSSEFNFEFVGARKESYSRKSRNPKVSPGLFNDDMKRRDFTINSLAISLNDDSGEVIDLFNGFSDIEKKLVKTCDDPSKTFNDDP